MVEMTRGSVLDVGTAKDSSTPTPTAKHRLSMFDRSLLWPAVIDAFRKLDPRIQCRNPVMFVVYIGSILTTVLWAQALEGPGEAPPWFIFNVAIWLWFTVLFANFAEALAEGRGKAQAASLRGLKEAVLAKKLVRADDHSRPMRVQASQLRKGDIVLVETGDYIPGDGEAVEGAAAVDESAITGESAPVIRESGGGFLLRNGRHTGAFGLARRSHYGKSRRSLH